MVNKVDLETIVGFSKGEAQSAQVREETVSWPVPLIGIKLMYSTLLSRLVTSSSDRIRMRSTPTSVLLVEGSSAKVSWHLHDDYHELTMQRELFPFPVGVSFTLDSCSMTLSPDHSSVLISRSYRWTQSGLPAIQLDTAYSAFVRPGPLHVSHLSLCSLQD
jgi:hypothetical protein